MTLLLSKNKVDQQKVMFYRHIRVIKQHLTFALLRSNIVAMQARERENMSENISNFVGWRFPFDTEYSNCSFREGMPYRRIFVSGGQRRECGRISGRLVYTLGSVAETVRTCWCPLSIYN